MTTDTDLEVGEIAEQLDGAYNKAELLAYAETFGTEVNKTISKKDLAARLAEDGITIELIKSYSKDADDYDADALGLQTLAPGELEETAPEADTDEGEDLVLLKMIRTNRTYQIRGYTFKTDHPFALVTEDDADYLIEVDGGFRIASPKEARAYYS